MLNVNELKRNAKNIVKKYSDAQVKVREATSNDPWGPSSTVMAEIAGMTHNVVAFSEIMQMIWKRLNDHGKNWRHVYKSLVLLEYLIKTGADKVAQQCIENIFAIQTLKDFQYIEENKDHGQSIREKSKRLVALLKDPERLKAERARAFKAKSRLIEAVSSSGKSSIGYMSSRNGNGSGDIGNNSGSGSGGFSTSNSVSFPTSADGDRGSAFGSDIDSARPQTLTEEETQLQIALALSKEEAERQEKTKKNDELRLKLALDVSKKTSGSLEGGSNDFMDDFAGSSSFTESGQQQHQQQPASRSNKQSNIDDLLGLSFTPSETTSQQPIQMSNPITCPFLAPSVPTRPEPLNDPWSVDPWQSSASSSAFQMEPQTSISSQVIAPQPTIVHQNLATPTTLIPTTVPNQLSVSDVDSIFGGGVNETFNPKKTTSKNPFEF